MFGFMRGVPAASRWRVSRKRFAWGKSSGMQSQICGLPNASKHKTIHARSPGCAVSNEF